MLLDYPTEKLQPSFAAVFAQGLTDPARAKDAMQPAVLVSGAGRHVTVEDGPGAVALLRAHSEDLFR